MKTTNPKIAIITSRFNEHITSLLYQEARKRFTQKGTYIAEHDCFFVAGAVEIPVIAAELARTKRYDAIVCFGAVIRGQTDHYVYVCEQVSYGCQKVAVEYGIPVIFGVLTTENEEQAFARCDGTHTNMGLSCADTALEMITTIRTIRDMHEMDLPRTESVARQTTL